MNKKELKKVNFRETGSTELLNMKSDSVPTLVPQKVLANLQEGDDSPYYKIQEIEYPIKANGWNYLESFFESFIKKLNDRPFPGSKSGHSTRWGENPPTDLFLVGGLMKSNGDGTGKVYFKNYIPKKFDSDNESFIRMAKAGLVHFSLVSYTRDEIIQDEKGDWVYNVLESMHGERNDAVEYDGGAMDQKTNSVEDQSLISASVSKAKSLINSGDFDADSSWYFSASDGDSILGDGEDWNEYKSWHLVQDTEFGEETRERYKYPYGKSGKVYRSALVAISQRASQQGLDNVAEKATELRELIDKKNNSINGEIPGNREENKVTKEEVLKALTTFKKNAELDVDEVAKALGFEIVGEKHKNAVAVIDELGGLLGNKDVVAGVKAMQAQFKENAKAAESAKMLEAFGPEKNEDGTDNLLRVHANSLAENMASIPVEERIGKIKENAISQKLAAERADVYSKTNSLVGISNMRDGAPAESGKRESVEM